MSENKKTGEANPSNEDRGYFIELSKMDRDSLIAEIKRLEEATHDYSQATSDQLAALWPASAKKAASRDIERLRLAREFLNKIET